MPLLILALLLAAAPDVTAAPPPRVYGDVAVSRDRIAFTLGGQLWEVPRAGGVARKLSTTPDDSTYPLYSPDGAQLAFTRANALWVMPSKGGAPRRLTWHPEAAIARAWTPDSRTLLFISSREGDGNPRAFTVPAAGGVETRLPVHPVRFASYAPDGKRLAMVARSPFVIGVGRRYYRGGMRDPIVLVDPATGLGPEIPAGETNVIFPMWLGTHVYYASDALGSFNLEVYDTVTKRSRRLTNWRSYGITSAAAGGGAIAFVRDGRIHLFDVATEAVTIPDIDVPVDTADRLPKSLAGGRSVTSVHAGPRGERIAIEARGDVIVLDRPDGTVRNLTSSSNAAERTPALSPDGMRVAYFSDASGEYALHVRPSDGSGTVQVIPLGDRPTYFFDLVWSPDGSRLLFSDQRLQLWLANLGEGRATVLDSSPWIAQQHWHASWSPDGRWIAYAKGDSKGIRTVWLRDVVSGTAGAVSRGGSDDDWPVFDPSGRWLYFASSANSGNAPARDVWALLSDMYAQPFISHTLMVTPLRQGDVLPMLPYGAGANPAAKNPPSGAFDVAGAGLRVSPLGAPRRAVEQLWMTPQGTLVMQATVGAATPGVDRPGSEVLLIDPAAPQKPVVLVPALDAASLSSDGTAVAARRSGEWRTIRFDGTSRESVLVDISKVQLSVDPRAEWQQIYHEAFRMMRDYFYDPAHHGVDLDELRNHYAAYLPQLMRRLDLNDLLLYAFGEISVSHVAVGGGDIPQTGPPSEDTGLLGVDYTIANGRYRLGRIVRNGPYQTRYTRAPLDQPGLGIREGEYLLAVDGVDVTADKPVDAYFVGKAEKPTTIRVARTPGGEDARGVVVVPASDESRIRLAAWAEANRREVERRSGGRLAYVHLGGWDWDGVSELNRALNGNPDAHGLIVDQRYNQGGITADAAIEALLRKPWYDYIYRHGAGFSVPQHLIEGPKVLIVDESNASAAETFAFMFRELHAGTIVGRRTDGSGIGGALAYQRPIDGGRITIPNRAAYNSRTGNWDIENHGVEPDVEVPITLADAVAGRDPQLARAVDIALKALAGWKPVTKKKPSPAVHPPR